MKVFVTGSNGGLGSNLCKHLLDHGMEVRGLVLPGSPTETIDDLDFERVPGDITDLDGLARAMVGCEWVFHTAALVTYWPKRWEDARRVNVTGTKNVIKAALKSGVRRLVHTSSKGTLAHSGDPARIPDETWPFDPAKQRVPYHATKYQAERAVLDAVGEGLDAVICNPTVIFGERDLNLNGARVFKTVRMMSPFYSAVGGTGLSDADDVAEGHVQAADRGRTGERYLMNNANLPAKAFFTLAAEVSGVRPPVIPIPYPLMWWAAAAYVGVHGLISDREPMITPHLTFMRHEYSYASAEKARQELGYGNTPARESMTKSYRWLAARGKV